MRPRWIWSPSPATTIGSRRRRDLVADRFTIEAMAHALAGVYAGVAAPVAGLPAS